MDVTQLNFNTLWGMPKAALALLELRREDRRAAHEWAAVDWFIPEAHAHQKSINQGRGYVGIASAGVYTLCECSSFCGFSQRECGAVPARYRRRATRHANPPGSTTPSSLEW
jgi:hypothetical protein